jgi:hypothetical protein
MAIATAKIALSRSAWTNCGTGPLQIAALGGSIVYQIADAQPSVPSPGYLLRVANGPVQIPETSIVWAIPSAINGGNALVSSL